MADHSRAEDDATADERCRAWGCFEPPVKGSDLCARDRAEVALDMHLDGEHGPLCAEYDLDGCGGEG